jgi:hypothetical protein
MEMRQIEVHRQVLIRPWPTAFSVREQIDWRESAREKGNTDYTHLVAALTEFGIKGK